MAVRWNDKLYSLRIDDHRQTLVNKAFNSQKATIISMAKGWFITFEGLDGSGKTTQLQLLAKWLKTRGYDVETTRQPGGTQLGERIRELLLNSRTETTTGGIDVYAELALMFADRAQSIAEIILPALNADMIVLCDRYTDSSEAYQGAGRGVGSETVRGLHKAVCGDLQPDLTIMLLPPLAASLARARRRNEREILQKGNDEGRFEQLEDSFHARVHAAYKAIAMRDIERVALIEDNAGIEEIHDKICSIIESKMVKF